ncbi:MULTISPECIES: hypothetical protein [unclassified Agarivorans]|uniref:hypothetical protein n=1 Tax=unclassified Agarivorans TaxID=2636026 RepID=UPI003D7C419F
MYDIHVCLKNQPGQLAALASLLGSHGVGLEGGGVFSSAGQSHAHFLVEDGEKAKQVLQSHDLQVIGVCKPLIRKLKQERPGELGEIAASLANIGVNIVTQYSDHANRLILITDNFKLAEQATKQWTVNA